MTCIYVVRLQKVNLSYHHAEALLSTLHEESRTSGVVRCWCPGPVSTI